MTVISSLCWCGLDLRTGCAEECSTILFFYALCSHFITPPNFKRMYLLKKTYLLMWAHNVPRGILFIRGYSQIQRTTPLSDQKGNYIAAIVYNARGVEECSLVPNSRLLHSINIYPILCPGLTVGRESAPWLLGLAMWLAWLMGGYWTSCEQRLSMYLHGHAHPLLLPSCIR